MLVAEEVSFPTVRVLKHGIRAIEVELYPDWHDDDDDADDPHLLEFRREWFRWLRGDERLPEPNQPKPSLRAEYDAMWTN